MLIESEAYDDTNAPPKPEEWGDTVYRHCTFDALDLEGVIFGGIMDGCAFTGCEMYWAFFNVALVAGTRFEDCTFLGASFRGCTFVDCKFVDCAFALDNLGSDCTIDDCTMAACTFERCEWATKVSRPAGKRDITKTRFLGCTQDDCEGFDGMF